MNNIFMAVGLVFIVLVVGVLLVYMLWNMMVNYVQHYVQHNVQQQNNTQQQQIISDLTREHYYTARQYRRLKRAVLDLSRLVSILEGLEDLVEQPTQQQN